MWKTDIILISAKFHVFLFLIFTNIAIIKTVETDDSVR